jgi:surface protein
VNRNFPTAWCGKQQEIERESCPKNLSMDVVTMVLVEREKRLPLDLVVLINSFLYEKLTDENFKQAVALWFEDEEECKWRFCHISDWKTSRVTNMEGAFLCREYFNEDLSRWDVGNVTNMRWMFCNATHFNRDISQWNVSKVTDMNCLFCNATHFNRDISQWNVSKVTDMNCLFCNATQFNQDISQWDVSNVNSMQGMFIGATSYQGVRWS